MADSNQDESLRQQFQQLQEQQQRRLQLAQQRRKTSKQNSVDTGSDKQASSFGVTDDMDLKVSNGIFTEVFCCK